LPKYLRSSSLNGDYKSKYFKKHFSKGSSTFEDEALGLGFINKEEEGNAISLANMIREIDYEAGNNFSYNYKDAATTPPSKGIIAVNKGKSYGEDIFHKITFKDNDLLTLNSDETLSQTAGILFNAVRGCVPEFEEKGMPSSLISNKNNIGHTLSMFIRNWNNLYLQDDIFSSVSVEANNIEEDNVNLALSIETKDGKILKKIIDVS
jgi:hypothetical protein